MSKQRLSRLRAAAGLVLSIVSVATGTAVLATPQATAGTSSGTATQAVRVTDTLAPGQTLGPSGHYIQSRNGLYRLTNRNGQIVLTRGGEEIWWARFKARTVLRVTKDGGLEFIHGRTRIGFVGATGSPGAKLVLRNDGILGTFSTTGKALWNHQMVIGLLTPGLSLSSPVTHRPTVTMYSPNRVYTLALDANGILLLRKYRTVVWSNRNRAGQGSFAEITFEGKLQTLTNFGITSWSVDTRRPGAVLQLLNDGTLRIVHGRTIVRKLH